MDFASRRRANGAANAIFARTGQYAAYGRYGGSYGQGQRGGLRRVLLLAGGLAALLIPLLVVTRNYFGLSLTGGRRGSGALRLRDDSVGRRGGGGGRRGRRAVPDEEDEDEEYDDDEDGDGAAGGRVAAAGEPVRIDGRGGRHNAGPISIDGGGAKAAAEPQPEPEPEGEDEEEEPQQQQQPAAGDAATEEQPADEEPPDAAGNEAEDAVQGAAQADAPAQAGQPQLPQPQAPAAEAPPPVAPAPGRHPVLFPARYAGAGMDPVPEPGCEAKWGNSWLRAFMDSRRDSCLPHLEPLKAGGGAALGSLRNYYEGMADAPGGAGGSGATAAGPKLAASRVTSWSVGTGANFHWMRNVAVDFGRMSTSGDQRQFGPGFVTAACAPAGLSLSADRDQPALGGWATVAEPLACEAWVHTPTVVIQHDDIGNTYHNLADFWRVWLGLAIVQQPFCAPLGEVNEDPTRRHGPGFTEYPAEWVTADDRARGAGGARQCPAGHVLVPGLNPDAMQVMTLDGRIMCNTVMPDGSPGREEDCPGPYFPQYATWFGKGVVRGKDYAGKRVCFSSLGWAASTPDSHIWDKFGEGNPCTTCPPLKRYAEYVAERWGQADVRPRAYRTDACRASKGAPLAAGLPGAPAGVPVRVPAPVEAANSAPADGGASCAKPYVVITYVQRKKKPFSSAPVQRRTISNDAAFIEMLKGAAPEADVDVVVADFTPTPYEQQMRIARASHVIIGMHGAGMVHGLDQADTDECGGRTALIELFPHPNSEKGIRNMNMQVGRNYLTWHNEDAGREREDGTDVNLEQLRELVARAVRDVLSGRKC